MASSATKCKPIFDEIISLIRGLSPCPYGEAVAQDRAAALVEVGGACWAASLVLPPPQQRTVRNAFVAWAGGYHGNDSSGGLNDSGVGNVGDKELLRHRSTSSRNEKQARAQGLAAWRAFCPTSNWDAQRTNKKEMTNSGAVDPKETLVFTRGAGDATALLVPLSFCALHGESGLPRMSTKVETSAACIDATVQVGDLLACSSASPHLPIPAQVTALWPQQHEVEVTPLATTAATIVRPPGLTHGRVASKRDGATMRLGVASLLGIEVVRPLAVASLDAASHQEDDDGEEEEEDDNYDDESDDKYKSSGMKEQKKTKKRLVCPAFTLPAADHLAALDLLRQRSARDAIGRAKLAKAAKQAAEDEPRELAQRVRLLAALRASELRNRNEARRLLKLLDVRRVSERAEWQKVGRALCAASPDLLGAWQEWTQESLNVLPHVARQGQVAVTSKGQQRRQSSQQQHAEQPTSNGAVLPSAKECEQVWRHMFRPPTTVDYGGGEFVLPASSSFTVEGNAGTATTATLGASVETKSSNFQEAWTMAGAAKRDYLRFVDPSNGNAVAVNASVVRDAPSAFTAQPSAHLPMRSAVVHVHKREEGNDNGWVPAEAKVGDWVTTRSRVQLCFVRVVALNLDPRNPTITVAKPLNSRTQSSSLKHPPPGTSGWMANNTSTEERGRKNKMTREQRETGSGSGNENDEVQEVWHDLGLLWGAWVWRALPGKNTDGKNTPDATHHGGRDRGLLWRLPCTAATTGLGELNAMVDSDAKQAAAEAAAVAAATAKDPRQTNAYYTTQSLHVPTPASTPAPKVVLVQRTADALTIGWALPKGTKLPVGSDKEAVVEVLVRVLKGGGDHDLSSSTYPSRTIDEPSSRMQQTALLSTVWNGENTSSSGIGRGSRQKKSFQGTRARNKLANGLVAMSSPLLIANDAAATTSTMKSDKKRVVNEWRELYRGNKNGCLVSELSPGRTYSLRVRVGANGRMTHVRLSTLPAPPPTPLVRRWAMVPRPNKDPRPSRERLLEVVLCGATAWHRHLKPPLTVQSQAAAEAPREACHRSVPFVDLALKEGTRGTGRTGGAFGHSSARFHGLRGGAQNGGGLHSSLSSSSLSRSHERLGKDSGGGPAKANASAVSSAKRVSVLPEGWCYIVERHLLPPSMAAALETEMENVLSGGVDDFFARNPILENDDVIAQDAAARTERARLYGAHVETSSSSSAVTSNKLQLPWVEVCRTRSMVGHVTGLESSPPLLASSSSSSSSPPSQLSPRTTSMSRDMGQDSSSVVVGDNDEDWPMTAREMKLRKLKKQFEAGYLFKPMRFGNDTNNGNGKTRDGQEAAKKKPAKQAQSPSASLGGSKRRIYVFRSFVESTQDPSVRSAPSALLVTEAPDTSRAVTFSIPKPPIDEIDDSVNEEDEPSRDSYRGHDNFGEKNEGGMMGVKDRLYDESADPFGEFGDFLNRLENLFLGSSTHNTSGINNSGGDGSENHDEEDEDKDGRRSRHSNEGIDDDDDDDNEEGLSDGWQAHWDEARQLPYFSHAASGLVQWQRPEAWHAPTTPKAPQLY